MTFEKKRFPSGSTVKRDELIVFKAPFVLWVAAELIISLVFLLVINAIHICVVEVFIATMTTLGCTVSLQICANIVTLNHGVE